MKLSGQQRKELQEAFIDAFPDKSSLEQMLSFELDKNLDEIAEDGNLKDIIFSLIKTANTQGWVQDLICGAYLSNPKNFRLKATTEKLLLALDNLPQELLVNAMTNITFRELEIVTKGILCMPIPVEANFTVLPPIEKMLKNELTEVAHSRLMTGAIQAKMVSRFIENTINIIPNFAEISR